MIKEETTISVTEAARNFSDYVNRAVYQGQTFLLTKNGIPVARLVPAAPVRCSARELAEAIRDVKLSAEDSVAWSEDIRNARKNLNKPSESW